MREMFESFPDSPKAPYATLRYRARLGHAALCPLPRELLSSIALKEGPDHHVCFSKGAEFRVLPHESDHQATETLLGARQGLNAFVSIYHFRVVLLNYNSQEHGYAILALKMFQFQPIQFQPRDKCWPRL